MDFFYGDLVQNEELNKTARQRKRKYHEITVSQAELDSYLQQGWQLKRQLKNRAKLFKEKECDELLEDEVWLLFENMGFAEMNRDRNFKIQAGPIEKQIDVFAKDGNDAFVVECKASTQGAHISPKDIHEISNLKRDITDSIKTKYNDRHIRVSFIIATQGMRWSEDNEKLAKNNGIFVWKEAALKSYGELIKHLGASAKFPIYSILFRNKKIPELKEIKVPAIYGGGGEAKYYSFIIEPGKLFPFAYVHRRESAPNEIADSYQRMVKKSRLKKINEFILNGGRFPNNIIISFAEDRKPRFDRKAKVGDITYGILTFPPYYASAWVIDGQHRLYGYANNERKMKDTVPVLAFESLPPKEQANLFVDINEKQVAVTPNLLWDLYPVIYADSVEEEHQIKQAISLIARKLNSDNDSPLRDHIAVPTSMFSKSKEITNLTMTTVCEGIKENRLINKKEMLLYKDDYDSAVNFACERLKVYFDVISKSFPEDWQRGEKELLRSNIGVRILFIILRQVMLYLKLGGQEAIYKKKDLSEFHDETKKLLNPMIVKLKKMPKDKRISIRKQVGKGPLTENAKQMTWWIKEEFDGFGRELLRNWAPPRPEKLSDEDIKQLLGDTEINLRSFIAKELKSLYGEAWWRQGIPEGIKNYANERIKERGEKEPWQKDALFLLPPERKLDYIATPHLREIIVYNPNWEHRFKHIFVKDKDIASAWFKFFEELRDTYGHHREQQCTEATKNLGYWGMKQIRGCIGLEKMQELG